jgi:hypothetical protein
VTYRILPDLKGIVGLLRNFVDLGPSISMIITMGERSKKRRNTYVRNSHDLGALEVSSSSIVFDCDMGDAVSIIRTKVPPFLPILDILHVDSVTRGLISGLGFYRAVGTFDDKSRALLLVGVDDLDISVSNSWYNSYG